MARRNYAVELNDKIAEHAKVLLKRPAEPNFLMQEAGYAQGLNAARLLFEEILRSENQREE